MTWIWERLTETRVLGLSEMFDTVATVCLLSADFVADQGKVRAVLIRLSP